MAKVSTVLTKTEACVCVCAHARTCTSGVVLVKMSRPWMMSVITLSFSCWYSSAVSQMDSNADWQQPHTPLAHKLHMYSKHTVAFVQIWSNRLIEDGNYVNYFLVTLVQLPVHGCPGRLKTKMDKREMKESSDEVRIVTVHWSHFATGNIFNSIQFYLYSAFLQ